jgi:glyoxylase-like metal-dependent hydrolase (beta-lactamase superfamily II)
MHKSILNDLWQVGGDQFTAPGDAAAYLMRCADRAVLVDAGCGGGHQRLVANIDGCLQASERLTHLLLTHCHFDHTGGAQAIRQTYGCKIVAHAEDAVYLEAGDSEVTAAAWYGSKMPPLAVDIKLSQRKTRIDIGDNVITAHHWPGHSPGSMVYVARMEDKVVLFGQDIHGPIHPALLSDPVRYQDSLKMVLALEADLLLEGHFGVIAGKDAVRRFIRSYMDR